MSNSSITVIQTAQLAPVVDFPLDQDTDVIKQLLADTRSPNTKRAYEKDLKDFFKYITRHLPNSDLVLEFLQLDQSHAVTVVLKYKAHLVHEKKLTFINSEQAPECNKISSNNGTKVRVLFLHLGRY